MNQSKTKSRYLAFLTFALAAFALLALTLAAQPPGGAAHAQAPANGSLPIYTDAVATGWEDWSWGGVTRVFTNTAPVHSGAASIAVTYTEGWSGLKLSRFDGVDVSAYDTLRFWVHGGAAGGQQIEVEVGLGDNVVAVTFTPAAGVWTQVDLPILGLGSPRQVRSLQWFNSTPGGQPIFYLDEIVFVHAGLPTPTPTATATPVTPMPGPALAVDVGADRRAISPDIYGMNFADEALAAELRLPVRRRGGNAQTRYNWQNDTSNRASDWFFENIPYDNDHPEALPNGSDADRFVEQDRRTGTQTLLTLPLIGWTPKSRAYACGFSVAKYGAQQRTDEWRPDCGNGVQPDASLIIGNDPADTSLPITTTFVQDWIGHLIGRYGSAAADGVRFYNLDNEPMLWNDTHRDVHPQPVGYDELRDRTYLYAAAIKAADPAALTLGPVLWGWTAYFYSALDAAPGGAWWENPLDRNAHGGVPFVAWYLAQMSAYEEQHGVRILDYLDLHYYPQAQGVALSGAGSGETQALRLRTTRSLWDPTYVDESWIADTDGGPAVRLIPRMKEWVAANYPGTKLAITEYNWGALDHLNGALAQADVLGIFGREGLDLATLWDPPTAGEPGAFAFRIYRNYDGAGAAFGATSVRAASADQARLAVYAAQRGDDDALTLVVINKGASPLTSTVTISGFTPAASAQVYRYSAADLGAIVRQPDLAVAADRITTIFPEMSITLIALFPGAAENRLYLPLIARGEPSPQAAARSAIYYVAPHGDDADAGTLAQPWRTIQHAADSLLPGDTAYIRAGIYHEHVVVTRSGAAGALITLAAYPGETATVDGDGFDLWGWGGVIDLSGQRYMRVSGLWVVNSDYAGSFAELLSLHPRPTSRIQWMTRNTGQE